MTTTLFASAARNAAAYTSADFSAGGKSNIRLVTDVTSVSSSGTVTLKLQGYDSLSNKWFDMHSATTAALGSAATTCLTVGSNVASTVANINVGTPLSPLMRVIATVATSTVTFSASIQRI